jgi:hypothetical protein
METNETIESLKSYIQTQKEFIQSQKKIINIYETLHETEAQQTEELKKQLAEYKQKFVNARWIAIYEFLIFFMETKGKIYDSSYFRSAFENIGLPLTEDNFYRMLEYAAEHLKRDEEYTKRILGK